MSDPIGTVRREDRRDGGHSLWQLVSTYERGADWICVYSTKRSNSGSDPKGFGYAIERFTTVIGAVPGTPAAEADPVALSRDELIDLAWRALHGQIGYRSQAEAVVNRLADRGVLRLAPDRESAR